MEKDTLNDIIEQLLVLKDDTSVPKNIRTKIDETLRTLQKEGEVSLRVHKALNVLAEISDDNNIQAYTRTQVWNIISLLESSIS
jgi:uncharacterized protein (UPF0147 family)